MPIVMVVVLYFAWLISWGGTVILTCTMGDTDSLASGMVMSFIFYLGAIAALPWLRLSVVGLVVALPLFPLMVWQIVWGVQLFLVVNVAGRNACYLLVGLDYGEAGGNEQIFAPYYILVSVGSLAALAAAHWRHRRSRKPMLPFEAFD